ncbi:MAG: hypothetical protein SO002_01960, partial [Candidatus Faecousia sp.]|nr:hypothetical protein [Candidatus Faecousia sp.]
SARPGFAAADPERGRRPADIGGKRHIKTADWKKPSLLLLSNGVKHYYTKIPFFCQYSPVLLEEYTGLCYDFS